jgi:glycosyltransferase involved in cell wall biosynthesis
MPILSRRRVPRAAVRDRPGADDILAAAARTFEVQYGDRPAAPIAVVIPALDEDESVGAVVRSVPTRMCGLATEVLLIDDGSSDRTGEEARSAGALVCRLPVNLGQGQALRLGYRLARERGASVIATVDADGQFDPGEVPALVAPIVAGEADFVNGSRRLGRTEAVDPARQLGLVVFGALVTMLTGTRITDPANGLRAFRAEVTQQVPLRQTQYQTAELLIGTIALGFRVREVPVTVFGRARGDSKKGGNFFYGWQFARVVFTTWWSARSVARQHRTRTPPARRART